MVLNLTHRVSVIAANNTGVRTTLAYYRTNTSSDIISPVLLAASRTWWTSAVINRPYAWGRMPLGTFATRHPTALITVTNNSEPSGQLTAYGNGIPDVPIYLTRSIPVGKSVIYVASQILEPPGASLKLRHNDHKQSVYFCTMVRCM